MRAVIFNLQVRVWGLGEEGVHIAIQLQGVRRNINNFQPDLGPFIHLHWRQKKTLDLALLWGMLYFTGSQAEKICHKEEYKFTSLTHCPRVHTHTCVGIQIKWRFDRNLITWIFIVQSYPKFILSNIGIVSKKRGSWSLKFVSCSRNHKEAVMAGDIFEMYLVIGLLFIEHWEDQCPHKSLGNVGVKINMGMGKGTGFFILPIY